MRPFQAIYLFRQPADALVSSAHFAGRAATGCDHFVRRQILTFAHHLKEAEAIHMACPERWRLLSDETLLANPEDVLLGVFRWLGVAPVFHLRDCVLASSHAALKGTKAEQKGYVSGTSGRGHTQLSAETFAIVDSLGQPVYQRLRELEAQTPVCD
jgi:hypothetical protein